MKSIKNKIGPLVLSVATCCSVLFGATSCEDLLDTKDDRQVFNPSLDQLTDSMFYTLGILKGVQQTIDQYVLVNEMRGDLVSTNVFSSADLKSLANFTSTPGNKYDSAYVYYNVINNCNYYIAHRDTTLFKGSRSVTMPEYVQAHVIRAWAYMQLAKNYGDVPFYTEPVTSISEANQVHERKNLQQLQAYFEDELIKMVDLEKKWGVPRYGDDIINVGSFNFGGTKYICSHDMMFHADLVLGDYYLETNQYEKAAKAYFDYLQKYEACQESFTTTESWSEYPDKSLVPKRYYFKNSDYGSEWLDIFTGNYQQSGPPDIITYVPMAVNRLNGVTTDLPRLFGFDSYAPSDDPELTTRYLEDREIEPSQYYYDLAKKQDFYYVDDINAIEVHSLPLGDMRRYSSVMSYRGLASDTSFNVMVKFTTGNIPVYRVTTVYMRLAEALNRMGYPDAAFLILKDGIDPEMCVDSLMTPYLRDTTRTMLATTVPFLDEAYSAKFPYAFGVHSHGSGWTTGADSPYQMDAVLQAKFDEYIAAGLLEDNHNYTMADTINAMEDILCDEYALEFAFEGSRFSTLTRLATHKNAVEPGAGSRWLARKLQFKNPGKDLTNEQNWYLPKNW